MREGHSIDFLKKKYQLAPKRKDRNTPKNIAKVFGALIVATALVGALFSYQIAETAIETDDGSGFSLFSTFRQLVTSDEKQLAGEEDDRINFLLTGVGGTGHAGPELTDTIIFASFKPSTNEIGMLSIPRDTIVEIPGYGYRKVNHVNAYAEIEEPGSGPQATADVLSKVLDQEIHYTLKVDFQGFQDLVDAVGGVDIYVDNSFTDYEYPTWDEKYQTISFEEGWQYMDGDTALKYARSRHGNNGEGSDFARAERQQNVMLAVKDKILTAGTLLNPAKLNKLVETVQDNVQTNLTFWEMVKFIRYAPDIDTNNISHYVMDSSADSPLYASNINGAYVLLPKKDDWSDVQLIAENIFSADPMHEESALDAIAQVNPASIEIQNGTSVTGLAFQASQLLSSSGFDVVKIGNSDIRGYEKTVIYDLTEGEKSAELDVLMEYLEAEVSMTESGWVYADEVEPRELTVTTPGEEYVTTSEPIDFLIILGQNATDLVLQ